MRRRITLTVAVALLLAGPAAADLATSKHNLSTSGPGPIAADSESRLCVFCHTPHNARPAVPLWNHESSVETYSTYTSTTLQVATPLNDPDGSSKLCLSCHDGTVALGQTVNDGLISLLNTGTGGRMPVGRANLGSDLTDDHPVSFVRTPANLETVDPPPGDPVKLDDAGKVQCISCHEPHVEDIDPVELRFLVKDNRQSAICTTCHAVDFWTANPSSHQSSTASYGVAQGAHTGYGTVRDNGCASCHRPHSGNEPQRLLKFAEELTCDACHDGTVAQKNIAVEFSAKTYTHPTYDTAGVHDASEHPTDPTFPLPETDPGARRHAECQDCHNPHATYDANASAPNVTGALAGTWGVNAGGSRVDPAPYQYQICYKCHAGSANKPQEGGLPNPPYTDRQIVQFDVALEFDPSNPSHHAIEGPGRNGNVPSLIGGYDESSILYCTDCHNNDDAPGSGGTAPQGPHGSDFNHILERNLNYGDNNTGSNYGQMYAMCFKCHSQTSILNDVSFGEHDKHIRGEDTSCMVCHDPHGVSGTQGSDTANSNLINFDLSVITPSGSGQLRFEDQGTFRGACWLTCHGEDHDPLTY